ncbi:expressed unknown protein [Seminavis robusta]|uniref:Uncharacterized protein n=1 Tax=Seminavis robusta TaxID=568900 RepID=A0A9N8EKY9_9STRA|nr:expressed unknown protein [Seminavis robusta]|eukprot:Sro1284_g259180.1 n/a (177) ;mRNA; r:4498-5253
MRALYGAPHANDQADPDEPTDDDADANDEADLDDTSEDDGELRASQGRNYNHAWNRRVKVHAKGGHVAKALSPKNVSPKKLVQRGRSKKDGPTRPNWCDELAKGEHADELGGRWFLLVTNMSRGTLIVPNSKAGKPCGKCRKSLKKPSAENCHHYTEAGENLQGSFGNQLPGLDDE